MSGYQWSGPVSRVGRGRRWAIVYYRNLPHLMDIRVLHRALRDRQIEGELDSIEGVAKRVEVSRSTVSRFLGGRNTSLTITLRIVGALDVTFDQVFMEIGPALLGRLQEEGMARVRNGVVVVDDDMLTWPEASEVRAHFSLPESAGGPAQRALGAARRRHEGGAGRQLPPGDIG